MRCWIACFKAPPPLRFIAVVDVPDKSILCAEYFMRWLADATGKSAMVLNRTYLNEEKPWVAYCSGAKLRIVQQTPV